MNILHDIAPSVGQFVTPETVEAVASSLNTTDLEEVYRSLCLEADQEAASCPFYLQTLSDAQEEIASFWVLESYGERGYSFSEAVEA